MADHSQNVSGKKKKTVRYYETQEEHDVEETNVSSKKRMRTDHQSVGRKPAEKDSIPIDKEKLKKYERGRKNKLKKGDIPNRKLRSNLISTEEKFELAAKQAARAELVMPEESGFLEADEGEETCGIDQRQIADAVDISSAEKHFELNLDQFGPYSMDFTRDGRYLLLGGRRGHLAAFEWSTKKLMFEINVMELVKDVRWLHLETMLAVAQKKWLYMYDNQGTEIHCLKGFNDVLHMEFLPYHFLLSTASATGYLQYLDISVGQEISTINTKMGRLNVMTHNPHNAIVHLGHPNGTVSLWSPNVKEPLVKILAHSTAVRSIAIDSRGLYMATSGQDGQLKVFDVRTYRPLQSYRLASGGATDLSFSQRGLLATARHNVVEVYKDACTTTQSKPYMRHFARWPVNSIQFCPLEDVLGVSHRHGYSSILVPGAGEANFDALENNPYRSKEQRRQWEVKALLEKVQPEMIALDPNKIGSVDKATAQKRLAEKQEILGYVPAPKWAPKYKAKGRSSSLKLQQRKSGVAEEQKRKLIKQSKIAEKKKNDSAEKIGGKTNVLDRFLKKNH